MQGGAAQGSVVQCRAVQGGAEQCSAGAALHRGAAQGGAGKDGAAACAASQGPAYCGPQRTPAADSCGSADAIVRAPWHIGPSADSPHPRTKPSDVPFITCGFWGAPCYGDFPQIALYDGVLLMSDNLFAPPNWVPPPDDPNAQIFFGWGALVGVPRPARHEPWTRARAVGWRPLSLNPEHVRGLAARGRAPCLGVKARSSLALVGRRRCFRGGRRVGGLGFRTPAGLLVGGAAPVAGGGWARAPAGLRHKSGAPRSAELWWRRELSGCVLA